MNTYSQKDIEAGAAFLARMLPELIDGKSFEDAGKAVLNRDSELWAFITSGSEEAEAARTILAENVYRKINATK